AVGAEDARAGCARRQLRHRSDLARLRDHVLVRARPVRGFRRRRSGAVPPPARGARARRGARRLAIVRRVSTTAQREVGLHIGGESVEGSETRELVEPATGDALATTQLAGEADIDRAVAAAREALDGAWGKTPP